MVSPSRQKHTIAHKGGAFKVTDQSTDVILCAKLMYGSFPSGHTKGIPFTVPYYKDTNYTSVHSGMFLRCVLLSHIMPIQGHLLIPFQPFKSFRLRSERSMPGAGIGSFTKDRWMDTTHMYPSICCHMLQSVSSVWLVDCWIAFG